ncbi:MAG: hypothetical protein M3M89_05800 [Thermoproteota archaeon]|nr:hypothetical protein [Thermoproteota archaeon]
MSFNPIEEQQPNEPLFKLDLDCHHSQIVLASKLAKPARRDAHTRALSSSSSLESDFYN